jgi:hypothetical protein
VESKLALLFAGLAASFHSSPPLRSVPFLLARVYGGRVRIAYQMVRPVAIGRKLSAVRQQLNVLRVVGGLRKELVSIVTKLQHLHGSLGPLASHILRLLRACESIPSIIIRKSECDQLCSILGLI